MRYAIFATAGSYTMLASAQATQNIATATEALTPFQSTQATCLAQCHVADTGCRTKCIHVHNPSGDPILAIQKCQAGCVQGDGSVEQTSIYGMCLQNCISTNGAGSTVGNAVALTASSAAATNTASSAAVPATTIGTSTGSKTSAAGSSASAVATGNSADFVRVAMDSMALIGLAAAFVM